MTDFIYLDPDVFMALGLAAAANRGVGCGPLFSDDDDMEPCCVHGLSMWLDGERNALKDNPTGQALYRTGLYGHVNDTRMWNAGFRDGERVPFARWCEIVSVDVKDAS